MIKAKQSIAFHVILFVALWASAIPGLVRGQQAQPGQADSWTFVSIPDFLNFDIEYPQEGWEDALGFVLESMKKENPAFAMVAGDLVMGHTPILGPVRRFSSSGMRLAKGRDSQLWKLMVKYNVDLYICGEVHAVTCLRHQGIMQVAHGGLFGRTTQPNYMVVTVHPEKLELNIKEIDLVNGKGRLWQYKKSRGPWDTITITKERRKEGFTSIGSVTIDKQGEDKQFESPTGFFAPDSDPTTAKNWVPERRAK